jgi:hypothetical protein
VPLYLSSEAMRAISGHLWTIAPWLRHQLRPGPAPATERFRCSVPDARLGAVSLAGRIRHVPDAGALLVVVHGLGGCSTSHYAVAAALAAERARLSCLRIDLRGASGDGEDFYHGGLDADLAAVLAAPEVQRYPHVYVLGYSMGGHLALRLAALRDTPRLRAVVALCPPLDLGATGASLDRSDKWIYRQHVLRGLRETVGAVALKRPELVPIGVRGLAEIRTLREWDERVVAPRHGFRSADHYYAEASVAPHLGRIELPALMVQAEADPMIPASTVRPALAHASKALTVRWVDRGGHVGFPARTDLTLGEPGSVEAQAIAWLCRAAA